MTKDFVADMNGDGKTDGERDHRYGCSGIDGVGIGPAFGRVDGPRAISPSLTSVYGDTGRDDKATIKCCFNTTSAIGPSTRDR